MPEVDGILPIISARRRVSAQKIILVGLIAVTFPGREDVDVQFLMRTM